MRLPSGISVLLLLAVPAAAMEPPLLPAPVPGYSVGWCLRVQGNTLEDAKAAGFEHVELALQDVLGLDEAAFEALVTRVRGLGIPALVGYNLVPNDLGIVGLEADRAKQDQHLSHALPRLARLGLKYVVLGSGKARHVPDGFPRERAQDQLAEFSRRLAREADRHRITVLVQPLRLTDTNLVNTIAEAASLVEKVDRANFQMLVDYSFMVIGKEEPGALLRARTHVRHVWMANPNGRVYPMDAAEADYAAFFAALKAIGYRGGIGVHARTDDFKADAPRAIAFLRSMAGTLAGAGTQSRRTTSAIWRATTLSSP